jgi:hypothetical protein
MASKSEFSDADLDEIVAGLEEGGEAVDAEPDTKVVRGPTVKRPSHVRVMAPNEVTPIDDETRRRMEKEDDKSKDTIIRTLRGSPNDPKVLAAAAEELADEIHSLKWERQRLEVAGRDIANTSGRRVTALKALIDTSLKLKELAADTEIDFSSPQMKIILNLVFTKIRDSLNAAGYAKQDVNSFFQVFTEQMQTFEIEAQRLIDQELRDS